MGSPGARRIEIVERAPDHETDDVRRSGRRRDAAARVASVAKHDEAIRHGLHLFDEVRNIDDRDAARLQTADEIEQRADVGLAEAAGRLVEHEDTTADGERAGDFDQLLCGGLEIAGERVGRDVGVTELAQRLRRNRAHTIALDDAAARRLDAEEDVLHHAEVRRERQLLVDHRDAGAACVQRIARRVRRTVEPHGAGVRSQGAREDGHQRALAGPVLADERADLARTHAEVHRIERHGGAERLADAVHLESRRVYGFSHRERSGCKSSLASASFMRSRVISRTPVSTRVSTGWP